MGAYGTATRPRLFTKTVTESDSFEALEYVSVGFSVAPSLLLTWDLPQIWPRDKTCEETNYVEKTSCFEGEPRFSHAQLGALTVGSKDSPHKITFGTHVQPNCFDGGRNLLHAEPGF